MLLQVVGAGLSRAVIQPDPAGTEQEELDEQQGWAGSWDQPQEHGRRF